MSIFSCALLLFSPSVVSDSLWSHGLQHARPPCPSPSPGACSNSCPLNQWCHTTISSCVTSFSSCPQSSPASRSLPLSQLFTSGGQSIGASASASVLPMNIQSWFLQDWLVWSPCCPGHSQESSPTPQLESINSSELSLLYGSTATSKLWLHGPLSTKLCPCFLILGYNSQIKIVYT